MRAMKNENSRKGEFFPSSPWSIVRRFSRILESENSVFALSFEAARGFPGVERFKQQLVEFEIGIGGTLTEAFAEGG